MKQRCTTPTNNSYKNYGAKGITVDPSLEKFEDYCAYVEQLPNYDPETKSLDRIDGTQGYVKGNLRWVSRNVQIANQQCSGKGFNRYTGVNWSITKNRWIARLTLNGKSLFSKSYMTELEALDARNLFIAKHNLPHPMQSH